jgi:hypothetical protein
VVADQEYYNTNAKAFIGLNPRDNTGAGFFFNDAVWKETKYGTAPGTNGAPPKNRQDLCTCDCKPSPDGIGCVGYGGIAFRYVSTLMSEGKDCGGNWKGQMVAMDCGAANGGDCNVSNPDQTYFQFIGEDIRERPGGAAIYSVATHLAITESKDRKGGIGGAFRQANKAVSCLAAIQDETDFNNDGNAAASCFSKCGDKGQYKAWLAYCKAATDTSATTGFKGWGV